jgi:hypothetical protein
MFLYSDHHDKNRIRNEQNCRVISAAAPVLIMKYRGPQHRTFLRGTATRAQDRQARLAMSHATSHSAHAAAAARGTIWTRPRPRARMYVCRRPLGVHDAPTMLGVSEPR